MLLIVENAVVLAVLLAVGLWMLSDELWYLFHQKEFDVICIHAYPDKLVYVAGKDTALDLTGGEICFKTNEFIEGMNGYSCELDDRKLDAFDPCRHVTDMAAFPYKTDADLTVPGIYLVTFADGDKVQCAFPIQVVDP